MTNTELAKLKKGDTLRHEPTGAEYLVLAMDTTGFPIVGRTISLHTAPDWEQVLPPAPALSIIERVTELDKRGWTFSDDPCARWISPDGYVYYSLEIAYKSRGCHPSKQDIETKRRLDSANQSQRWPMRCGQKVPVKSFSDARVALHAAGWRNVYGKVWLSPEGQYHDGTLAAYKAYTKPSDTTGDCNAS